MNKIDRIWLLRAMCHCKECKCADRGGMADDYDMCRIVSRHANAVLAKLNSEKVSAVTL